MIVDTHAHIYSPDEVAYPVIEKPYRPPVGMGTPERLWEEMRAAGVDRAMLLQTTTFYGWDNSFVRDTAAVSRAWAVGVCTLNPDDPHSTDVLYALVERSNVKALRTYASGVAKPHGTEAAAAGVRRRHDVGPERSYDTPGNRKLYAAARECGIVINALLNVKQADGLTRVLTDFPDVPVVLDHCLALDAQRDYEATVQAVLELTRFPQLRAKLTFLPTGSAEDYPFKDLHGACRQFIDAYGPERCVWGSDYPTELWCPKTTYAGHLDLFRQELGLSAAEQEAILGGTAERLYRLT